MTLKSLSPTARFCCAMDFIWIESINSSVERVTSRSALGGNRPIVATGLPSAILRISVAGSLASVASVWTDVDVVVAEEGVGGMAMEVVLGGRPLQKVLANRTNQVSWVSPTGQLATRLEDVSWLVPVESGLLAGRVGTGSSSKTLRVFLAFSTSKLR